jgi:hypothetical protein
MSLFNDYLRRVNEGLGDNRNRGHGYGRAAKILVFCLVIGVMLWLALHG